MAVYDVFISHCGADCKRDFAVWLKTELENVGLRCFFDEHSLKVGDVAADKMKEAMETATYGIVILSPGFFEREWCMKELQTFTRREEEKVLPIFFGPYETVQAAREAAIAGKVWTTFEQFVRTEKEYVAVAGATSEWTGVRLAEEAWWSSCIRRVWDEVLRLLGKEKGGMRISGDDLFVGQQQHLSQLKRLLGVPEEGREFEDVLRQFSQEEGIVGVKGMGGVGKSTLAKKLYDERDVREWFTGGICWLEVGPKPSDDKIRDLQRQMLTQLCNSTEDPGNPTRGRELLKLRLQGRRVLIVLDDVWEDFVTSIQVVTTAGLGSDSRILKTSRNGKAVGGVVHDLDVLGQEPAWELFCWHAFGGERPWDATLANAAEKAARLCGGLPLALTLAGGQVASASPAERQECLDELVAFLEINHSVDGCGPIIKRSYEELPADPPRLRDVLMLIAGVWPQTFEFTELQQAVENIGAAVYGEEPVLLRFRLARKALDNLNNRSLIKLERSCSPNQRSTGDDEECIQIRIHDLIVGVAEGLVKEAPLSSRFFSSSLSELSVNHIGYKDLMHVHVSSGAVMLGFVSHLVTASNNRVLSLNIDWGQRGAHNAVNFQEPHQNPLRFLSINQGQAMNFFPSRRLQCLRLVHCEFDPSFQEGLIHLESLNVLQIRGGSFPLSALPHSLRNLTSLELSDCRGLEALPESIGYLTALTALRLRKCQWLKALPEPIGQLTCLQELNLDHCKSLTDLHGSVGQLTKMRKLGLFGCNSLTVLQESVGHLTGLTELKLGWCHSLGALPRALGQLTGLTKLGLNMCKALRVLPVSVGQLTGLEKLDLDGCKLLTVLPPSVGQLTGLMVMDLSNCKALTVLPDSMGQLRGLTKLDLFGCEALRMLPEWASQLTGLTKLNLAYCLSLTALPNLLGQLTGLMKLELAVCKSLMVLPDSIGQLTGLRGVDLCRCELLTRLPESVGQLTGLTELNLSECKALLELPAGVGRLLGLTELNLNDCEALMALPESLGQLTGLTKLGLKGCESLMVLPASVGQLLGLTKLELNHCRALTALPESVGQLTGLTKLDLSWCDSLTALPESVGQLLGLTTLKLEQCGLLTVLPESVGQLTGLTELERNDCEALRVLPKSVGRQTGLTKLELGWCNSLMVLPDTTGIIRPADGADGVDAEQLQVADGAS